MKTIYAVILCVLLLLLSACSQKVNDPADVKAIKKSMEDYVKAANAGDAGAVAALMTDKYVQAGANAPAIVGKEACKSAYEDFFGQFKAQASLPVEEVLVAGSRAVARGTWSETITPKEQGTAPFSDRGSWSVFLTRQNDGSWKWDWLTFNSDQPAPGSTASGEDEKALLQIERDWNDASIKRDAAVLDKILAKEFHANYSSFVGNRNQFLASLKSDPTQIQSSVLSDMNAFVLGDQAIVQGLLTVKSSKAGKDTSGQDRFVDVFVKRDGRWQCVTGYSTKVQ